MRRIPVKPLDLVDNRAFLLFRMERDGQMRRFRKPEFRADIDGTEKKRSWVQITRLRKA